MNKLRPIDRQLYEAVSNYDDQTAASLLGQGANPDIRIDGWPLLVLAVETGATKCARLLLQSKANVRAVNPFGDTALHAAAARNQNVIPDLLHIGADINAANKDGCVPLMLAIIHDRPIVAERLITAGANLWIRNHAQKTAADLAKEWREQSVMTAIKNRILPQLAETA
jgi:ankyrin repeat protein